MKKLILLVLMLCGVVSAATIFDECSWEGTGGKYKFKPMDLGQN